MDFARGIPPESRTLVVIPTMLVSDRNVRQLLEALEVRFLANQDENLHFGLLTDFRDADSETTPEDEPLLRAARAGIEELNEKYIGATGDRFDCVRGSFMSIATASSVSPAIASLTGAAAPSKPANALGQTDFLKLLMAQMQHQNPTSPTSAEFLRLASSW